MRKNLSPERCEELKAIAADLIEDFGITEYPFGIWSLLRTLGVRRIPYSALPGWLRGQTLRCYPDAVSLFPPAFNPARTIVFYNDAMSRERVRFTLAHELAHLVLQHPDTGEDVYEHEADFFANYLLGPAPLVLRDSSLDEYAIQQDFGVSYSCAVAIRDRAWKRKQWGPRGLTEYERRILACCRVARGGGQVA